MVSRLNKLSLYIGVPGIIIHLTGLAVMGYNNLIGIMISAIGFSLITIGVLFYLKSKGRHWSWIFLLLLDLWGLVIIYYLADYFPQTTEITNE